MLSPALSRAGYVMEDAAMVSPTSKCEQYVKFCLILCFEGELQYAAKPGLQFSVLPPQPPECLAERLRVFVSHGFHNTVPQFIVYLARICCPTVLWYRRHVWVSVSFSKLLPVRILSGDSREGVFFLLVRIISGWRNETPIAYWLSSKDHT